MSFPIVAIPCASDAKPAALDPSGQDDWEKFAKSRGHLRLGRLRPSCSGLTERVCSIESLCCLRRGSTQRRWVQLQRDGHSAQVVLVHLNQPPQLRLLPAFLLLDVQR